MKRSMLRRRYQSWTSSALKNWIPRTKFIAPSTCLSTAIKSGGDSYLKGTWIEIWTSLKSVRITKQLILIIVRANFLVPTLMDKVYLEGERQANLEVLVPILVNQTNSELFPRKQQQQCHCIRCEIPWFFMAVLFASYCQLCRKGWRRNNGPDDSGGLSHWLWKYCPQGPLGSQVNILAV